MRKRNFQEAFDKLAAAEQAFLACEFLAPVIARGQVQVRLAGVALKLSVTPADFRGFGVFQPTSATAARLARAATLRERRQYLELFPLVRLILCRQERGECRARKVFDPFFDRRGRRAHTNPSHTPPKERPEGD